VELGRVLIAVSGTGGHVYPGIALAQVLRARHPDWDIVFAAAKGKPGADWIERAGFATRFVSLRGFARRPTFRWLLFPFQLVSGLLQTLGVLRRERPSLVVGTGGYVSGPFVAFAALSGIPTIVLEQNAIPGVATRLACRFARETHVAVPEAKERLPHSERVFVSGNPVRREIEFGDPEPFWRDHTLDPRLPTVVVIGGSQGAVALTEAALGAAALLVERPLQWVIQTGARAFERTSRDAIPASVRLVPFLQEMGPVYAGASLVVARAGAMTLAELAASGTPAVLVPYPFAAEDHQTVNARRAVRTGGAAMIAQADLSPASLAAAVGALIGDEAGLRKMGEAARSGEAAGARETIASACEAWVA
jgi:UDP-N-acetylglucosamine--N-acetylmuramyl-(pentapeptide) pyrophosphoryl-undecaprenol N-acetylglucosamine transferase